MNYFSLIIPAYNEEKIIKITIPKVHEILFEQDKYELILIDNGSTDNTVNIAKENGFRVFKAPGKTIAELRNIGAQNANGEYLAFLDADCIPHPQWFNRAFNIFQNSNIVAYGTKAAPPEENATWVEKTWFLLASTADIKETREVDWLSTFNLIIKKDAFLNVGGFNTNLVTCEDSDLGYKLSKIGKLVLDGEIATIHLRDSKTIKEFLKREYWRGKGNFQSILNHNFSWSELPSLILPLLFFIFLILLPFTLLYTSILGKIISLSVFILIIIFPTLMILKKKVPLKHIFKIKGPYVLSFLYLIARGASIFAISSEKK